MWRDQSTRSPALAGWNGATGRPACAKYPAQAPSEPSRAQLAPPKAMTVAGALTDSIPCGVSNRCAAPFHPTQRQRVRTCNPISPSRSSQARSSGDAFIACGKTRPVDPAKVAAPMPSAQARTASGVKACNIGRSAGDAPP